MPNLELPHTPNCLVCGHANPHGLHLHLHVDELTGQVTTTFTPAPHHIGFESIAHGGILATVFDEAMVWAATWACRCFCVCAELTVRFKHKAAVGQSLNVFAETTTARSRMIQTHARIENPSGLVIATATGKYMSVPRPQHDAIVATLIDAPATAAAAARLKQHPTP